MTPLSDTTASDLDSLLAGFGDRLPDVAHVIAVSVDGLLLARSAALPVDRADQLAAITSGLVSLTTGAARCLDGGRVRQTVVDMDGGALLMMAVGERAYLAVLGVRGADLGRIGYETALLAYRVAGVLEPGARVAGQI